jgi:hypothetical protein
MLPISYNVWKSLGYENIDDRNKGEELVDTNDKYLWR